MSPSTSHDHARRAAVERSLGRSFRLTCGHYTSRDSQLTDPPRRGLYLCETCQDWLPALPPAGSGASYPEEPPF